MSKWKPSYVQGKYAQAQPLAEKVLEIRRRLLTDDHPDTGNGYNNVAGVLDAQGKYTQARPLHARRRWRSAAACSPTTTPTPPKCYNNIAYSLYAQGKYAEAQPLL